MIGVELLKSSLIKLFLEPHNLVFELIFRKFLYNFIWNMASYFWVWSIQTLVTRLPQVSVVLLCSSFPSLVLVYYSQPASCWNWCGLVQTLQWNQCHSLSVIQGWLCIPCVALRKGLSTSNVFHGFPLKMYHCFWSQAFIAHSLIVKIAPKCPGMWEGCWEKVWTEAVQTHAQIWASVVPYADCSSIVLTWGVEPPQLSRVIAHQRWVERIICSYSSKEQLWFLSTKSFGTVFGAAAVRGKKGVSVSKDLWTCS